MSYFSFEIKKIKDNKFFIIMFALAIIALISMRTLFVSPDVLNYKLSVAVIDNDNSIESRNYIENLKLQEILQITSVLGPNTSPDSAHFKKLNEKLINSQIEAIIEIPADYFKDITIKKINYYYLSVNAVAPVLIDVISQDLMLPIASVKLDAATTRFIGKEWRETSKTHFDELILNSNFSLETNSNETSAHEGLLGEFDAKKINLGRTILGFSNSIIALVFCFSFAIAQLQNIDTKKRELSIYSLYFNKTLYSRLFDYSKLAIIWAIAIYSIASGVGLKAVPSALLFAFGLVCLIFNYEVIHLIYNINSKSHMSNLFAIGFIILTSLFGGAYFPVDMFPKSIIKFVSFIPFFQLNEYYYISISKSISSSDLIPLLATAAISIVLIVTNYKLGKK